jgi:hypothetical protein
LDSKVKRKLITDYFQISECNNRQLFKRLNMMGISINQLKKIMNFEEKQNHEKLENFHKMT